MALEDKRNKKVISSNVVYCRNFWKQGTGLIFRSHSAVDDCAWVFVFNRPRKISITMAFVFFPIDLLFLDAGKRIVEMKPGLKPWSLYNAARPVHYAVELDAGTIRRAGMKIGDVLSF